MNKWMDATIYRGRRKKIKSKNPLLILIVGRRIAAVGRLALLAAIQSDEVVTSTVKTEMNDKTVCASSTTAYMLPVKHGVFYDTRIP